MAAIAACVPSRIPRHASRQSPRKVPKSSGSKTRPRTAPVKAESSRSRLGSLDRWSGHITSWSAGFHARRFAGPSPKRRQTATEARAYPALAAAATISASALLDLARWCQERREAQQGAPPCEATPAHQRPPACPSDQPAEPEHVPVGPAAGEHARRTRSRSRAASGQTSPPASAKGGNA